jgi:hypothetical protein
MKSVLLSDQEKVGTIWLGVFRGVKTIAVPRNSLQIRAGLWERETYRYIKQAAEEACWVINIGAGSGELSIFFATRTRANPIIAIEPWDTRLLRQNIELNGPNRITIIDQYLGIEENRLPLDFLEVPRDQRGFIKLDADFAELSILQSGERLLAEAKPSKLIQQHWKLTAAAISRVSDIIQKSYPTRGGDPLFQNNVLSFIIAGCGHDQIRLPAPNPFELNAFG